jgi:hypothetical protein
MKTTLLSLALLALVCSLRSEDAPVAAEAAQPAVVASPTVVAAEPAPTQPAQAAAEPVSAAAGTGAAVETASPSPSPTAVWTPIPSIYETASPTPEPVATPRPKDLGRISLEPATWSIALKGGSSAPLGDMAQYNNAGSAAGLDIIRTASDGTMFGPYLSYSSQSYKAAGAQPLSTAGLGVKLLFNLFVDREVSSYAGFGIGGYYCQRTRQELHQPVPTLPALPTYDPVAESVMGLGLLGTLGARWSFNDHWAALLELNVVSINLAGGTSDSLLLAQPYLGLSYKL